MKKILFLIMLLISIVLMVGCNQPTTETSDRGWYEIKGLSMEGNFLDNINSKVLGGTLVNVEVSIVYNKNGIMEDLFLQASDVDFLEVNSSRELVFQRKPLKDDQQTEKDSKSGLLKIILVIKQNNGSYTRVAMVEKK